MMEWFSDVKNSKVDLSIIIPMYNVEEYIVETLNSMRAVRDFRIELILIDDGSSDNTLKLAKEWVSNNDVDTFILSKENSGPSIARNLGLSKARGELVTFFDSDDIALSYLYTDIINVMLSHNIDYCIFRGGSFDHVTQKVHEFPDYYVWDKIMGAAEFKVLTPHQEPRLARLEPSAVVRVFRKEFITSNGIKFPEKVFFEDVLFHAKCILNAKKVALLNKTLLLYRVNREGQTTSSFGKKRHDILKVMELIISDYSKMRVSDDIWANLVGLLIRMNVWCSENCAYEDKANFVKKSISLFSLLPVNIIEMYMKEYSYNDWERKLCKAFLEKNEKVLNISAEGGYPTFEIADEPLPTNKNKASLDSIEGKLEHLFSQQREGWAHDRFNVLNSKLEALVANNKELKEKLERKGSILAIINKFLKG